MHSPAFATMPAVAIVNNIEAESLPDILISVSLFSAASKQRVFISAITVAHGDVPTIRHPLSHRVTPQNRRLAVSERHDVRAEDISDRVRAMPCRVRQRAMQQTSSHNALNASRSRVVTK